MRCVESASHDLDCLDSLDLRTLARPITAMLLREEKDFCQAIEDSNLQNRSSIHLLHLISLAVHLITKVSVLDIGFIHASRSGSCGPSTCHEVTARGKEFLTCRSQLPFRIPSSLFYRLQRKNVGIPNILEALHSA